MFNSDSNEITLDCHTCLAANTTACSECVVSHLLANDDGPIDFVPTPVRVVSPVDRAIELLTSAGLISDPPVFVERAEFEAAGVHELTS